MPELGHRAAAAVVSATVSTGPAVVFRLEGDGGQRGADGREIGARCRGGTKGRRGGTADELAGETGDFHQRGDEFAVDGGEFMREGAVRAGEGGDGVTIVGSRSGEVGDGVDGVLAVNGIVGVDALGRIRRLVAGGGGGGFGLPKITMTKREIAFEICPGFVIVELSLPDFTVIQKKTSGEDELVGSGDDLFGRIGGVPGGREIDGVFNLIEEGFDGEVGVVGGFEGDIVIL